MKDDKIQAIATTGRKWNRASEKLARQMAEKLAVPYAERGRMAIPELCESYGAKFALVAKQGLLTLVTPEAELFFHPNMAHLRLKNLRFGDGDRMAEAMDLQPGMDVLDCTLGFGADAIVASSVVGNSGSVTGLESQPLIEAVVGYGLANYTNDSETVIAAMRRVQTHAIEAYEYLQAQPDDSVDVIYFDPMFRHPFAESKNIAPLRPVANKNPLSLEVIAEAQRVARHRIVLKESSKSREFDRLGFTERAGGRYSKVQYGVMRLH
ncbi:MAG: class I SAM-dependent methyltransferase [Selenomonas sp.]|nr:class I SAM-dependent methyltransferase [Selenomonas sp.]